MPQRPEFPWPIWTLQKSVKRCKPALMWDACMATWWRIPPTFWIDWAFGPMVCCLMRPSFYFRTSCCRITRSAIFGWRVSKARRKQSLSTTSKCMGMHCSCCARPRFFSIVICRLPGGLLKEKWSGKIVRCFRRWRFAKLWSTLSVIGIIRTRAAQSVWPFLMIVWKFGATGRCLSACGWRI